MPLDQRSQRIVRRYGRLVDPIARRYRNPITGKPLSGTALLAKVRQGEGTGVSSAGARKAYQFIPKTRAEIIRRFGIDPWASEEKGAHAATIHLRGLLGHRKGLEGYNPGGGQGYVNYILKQKVGDIRGRGSRSKRRSASSAGSRSTPGVNRLDARRELLMSYIASRDPMTLLQIAQTKDIPPTVRRRQGKPVRTRAVGAPSINAIASAAKSYGLRVGQHPKFGGVGRGHVKGSYHFQGKAVDVSGDAVQLARFHRAMRKRFGPKLAELIYKGPGRRAGNIKHGKVVPPGFFTGHEKHVHAAIE